MHKPLREKNECGSCGYTWFPRGKNISSNCPKCKSEKVRSYGPGIISILVFLFIVFIVTRNPPDFSKSSKDVQDQTISNVQSSEPISHIDSEASLNKPLITETPTITSNATINTMIVEPQSEKTSNADAEPPFTDFEKIFSDEEIAQMEKSKQYHGDDLIIRRRLGLPSKETKKLIP